MSVCLSLCNCHSHSMFNGFVCVQTCVCLCLPRAYMSLSALFQVLLGEVNSGLNTTQVVVKELKASASVQEQMHFLEEAQPYRYTFTSVTRLSGRISVFLSLSVSDDDLHRNYNFKHNHTVHKLNNFQTNSLMHSSEFVYNNGIICRILSIILLIYYMHFHINLPVWVSRNVFSAIQLLCVRTHFLLCALLWSHLPHVSSSSALQCPPAPCSGAVSGQVH